MIFTFIATGQSWFDGNPEWLYNYNSWSCITPEPSIGSIKMYHINDTIINDLELKHYEKYKVVNQMGDTLEYSNDVYFYEEPDKVYEYIHGELKLLYDFTFNVNDTLFLETSTSASKCDSITVIVLDSISSVNVAGQNLRQQHWRLLNSIDGLIEHFQVLEKVGRLSFSDFTTPFLMDCSLDICRPVNFECYKNADLGIEYSTGDCEELVLNTEIHSKCNNFLFPNPTSDFVRFNSDCEIREIRLYDLKGEKVAKSFNSKLDISHFQSGMYICQISMLNGAMEVHKVVKE